jgi:hypothetical protein
MANSTLFTLPLLLGVLAGCATPPYEGKYSFYDGWRKGQVERVVGGADLANPGFWNCTRKLDAQARSQQIYVIVSYRRTPSRTARHLVALESGESFSPKDAVYVNVGSCEHALVRQPAPQVARPAQPALTDS